MTAFTSIGSLLSTPVLEGQVALRGWVYRTRSSGKIVFAVLRDSTGIIQVTIKKGNLPDAQFEEAAAASIESSVEVTGTMHQDGRAPGGYEVLATSFKVVGPALPFPITEYQSEELLLDNRHLWIRSREQTAVMKVKATLLAGAREWLAEQGFTEVTPPILTQNACEGGVTLFKLRYFDRDVFLSQSAQMYLESLIFALEKVYSITPSFRAEKSRTPRHLTEYWHLELEEAWTDNEGNMRIQEELVSAMVAKALKERGAELELLKRDIEPLKAVQPPFERLRYADMIALLRDKGFAIEFGADLGAAEERAITEDKGAPVFVTNFPKQCKAFYMKEDPDDPRTYKCADLLAPFGFGEVIGGSERETDLAKLLQRMEEQGIPQEPYRWYLDLRRFGSVPHSGFGMGVERMVKWVCNLEHIRDAIPYPRTVARAYP
ncbi:MAG TPA: asparagine--tRNA ligase [Methanomassiliicoccales archaeon]|nr:asparagine--tRNA ligase [Methanomassiliicoccales archaeon]HQM66975.1 asparagine--tRNA ligase [Methanomassiliicoccales archaeon]HRR66299.1 asparagine--tRNA ligase [Methanomassiliicoccales archaeon]